MDEPAGPEPDPASLLAELAELARSVATAISPRGHDDLLRSLTATARALFGAAACSLALLEPADDDDDTAPDRLRFVAADGEGADQIRDVTIPVSDGIAGWVVQSAQPVAVSDLRNDPRFARAVAEQTGYVPRAILAVPVADGHGPIGVLTLLDRDVTRDGAGFDLQTASLFAEQAAIAITSARASSDLAGLLLGALADAAGSGTPLADTVGAALRVPQRSTGDRAEIRAIASLLAELTGRAPADADVAVRVLREFLAPRLVDG